MKILITGASGFLGSWICRVLAINHDVIALVRLESIPYRLKGIDSIKILNRKATFWPECIIETKPDILILGDWWGVENKYRNNKKQFKNVDRILELVKAAKKVKVNTIIGIGSQAEIGPVSHVINEDSPDNPSTIYGHVKVKTREEISRFLNHSKCRFVWMRIFSSYGPLDTGNWLIPKLVDTLTVGKKMELTNCEQEWNYLHAYDLALAFEAVVNTKSINSIVNVGNTKTINLKSAILEIANQLDSLHLLDFGALDYRDDQVMKLEPNCEKLITSGWEPIIEFESGIKQTVLWLQRNKAEVLITKHGEKIILNLPVRPYT